jgi:hypothetical protein
VVGTVLSQLRYLDITGPGLKWVSADGFQQQCYPLLAARVGDYLEQVLVSQVSYGSCQMCDIPNGEHIAHSIFRPLHISSGYYIYSELVDDINLGALHTLGVCPIRNPFWQYPLCNAYRLWLPDELHQLLFGFVTDL